MDAIRNRPFKILPNLEPSDGDDSGEMRLWRDIPDPYTGEPRNIVLRSIVEPFWQSCIDTVNSKDPLSGARYRVCAIGTPGIGKTYTTPLLLRMLLLQRSTVVYIRRSDDRTSWFYEFVPKPDGEMNVTVNVYPEASNNLPKKIPSLKKNTTYYVVDPGVCNENCNPGEIFKPRVIIISSPNEQHWGGKNFQKLNSKQVGVFQYYPLWSYSEVRRGLVHFTPAVRFSSEQLAERYRQVGGVPRNLIAGEKVYNETLAAAGARYRER